MLSLLIKRGTVISRADLRAVHCTAGGVSVRVAMSSSVTASTSLLTPASTSLHDMASDGNNEFVETTHLFVELTSLDELSFPTSSSSRIKYTCLDASPHYLAVGSSSGTVYLFSRYASKYRSRLSSIPVQVVSTKDGPVIKMAISPDEKYLASAGLRGPLTVSALSTVGHSPTTIVSNTCHVGNVDASQANHVTELRWSDDSRKVYAGDLKGQVSCTRIQSRNLFRSPCDVLLETDSAIVQIDVRDESLLVSTLTRCCLCDLATLDCIQVGKKLRHGRFGAMFYPTYRHRVSRDEERRSDVVTPRAQADSSISPPLIFASRPNGRLWEANGQGIVYSTHQYRSLSNIARFPVVSFKEDFSPCNISCAACGKHLAFGRLHLIDCQQNDFILTKDGCSLYLIDPTDGRFVLACDIDKDAHIGEYAVCGSDVFVLCDETGKLRKLSLFTMQKAVEKLHWKQCFNQAAQVICAMAPQIERSGVVPWRREVIQDIISNSHDELSHTLSDHSESTNTKNILQKMLLLSERQRSCSGSPSQTLSRHPVAVVHRLNTGIHRVVRIMDNSGYEDDFTFRAPSPLRQRSKSTPNMEGSVKTMAWKRRSLPLKQNTHQESVFEEKADGEEGSEQVRQRLIQEAFHLLDAESSDEKCLVSSGSADSLRTLLACGEQRVTFHSQVPHKSKTCPRTPITSEHFCRLESFKWAHTKEAGVKVTLGDVPRDLVAAKKLLRLIADKERRNGLEECASGEGRSLENVDHLSATSTGPDFTSLFGRRDPLEGLARCPPSSVWSKEPVSVERLRVVKRPKKGARIVKAIKPLGRPTCGTLDFTFSVSEKDAHFNPKLADGKDDSNMASVGSRERLAPSMNNEHLGTLEAVTLGKENAVAEVVEVGERMRNSNTTITASTLLTNDGKVLVRRSPKLVVTNQPKVVASIVTTQRLNNSSPSSEANVTKRSEPDTLINTSYVIENNFVADKKLKVSWTMASPPTQNAQRRLFTKHAEASTGSDEENNTDRDERERARISEKDDVSEDDTDERLMELSEVTLAPSTVSSTETAGARAVGNDYCENCTMHKSWRTVMAFGPAMSQLKVTADEFANGGVPSCMEQWSRLLTYYIHSLPVSASSNETPATDKKNLCEECFSFFDFSIHMKRKIAAMGDWLVRAQKRNREDKRTENIVRKVALAFDEPTARRLFFRRKSGEEKGSVSSDVAPSTSAVIQSVPPESLCRGALKEWDPEDHLPVGGDSRIGIRSETMNETPVTLAREKEGAGSLALLKFAWISALTLSQLLFCMRLCEGIDAVFGFLKSNATVTAHLSQEDWQWLTVLKAREVDRWKDVMPRQIVDGLLCELNITSIKDVGPDMSDSSSELSRRFHLAKQSPSSVVILVDGNCPCCTLPLKGRVSDTDCYVTSFHCGHSYHKVCLREANISRCIRCEIERRRQRQQAQQLQQGNATSQISPSIRRAAPSATQNGAVQAARHIPVRAARVNVTLPPTPKTLRRT